MFKIFENDLLIEETTSGVLCAMYQAFRDNGCNIDDSLSDAKVVHLFWIKLDYQVDINKLVDYICINKINLHDFDYRKIMTEFNEWLDAC